MRGGCGLFSKGIISMLTTITTMTYPSRCYYSARLTSWPPWYGCSCPCGFTKIKLPGKKVENQPFKHYKLRPTRVIVHLISSWIQDLNHDSLRFKRPTPSSTTRVSQHGKCEWQNSVDVVNHNHLCRQEEEWIWWSLPFDQIEAPRTNTCYINQDQDMVITNRKRHNSQVNMTNPWI